MALVMVGLPARGKSFVARKLQRYLAWLGYSASVFNVGQYRRALVGSSVPHEFFDPDNATAQAQRLQAAGRAMDDMLDWLDGEGQIGIYDATNSTVDRRTMVLERCRTANVEVMFVESVCEVEATIEANIRATKLRSPDYVDVDPDDAVKDFRRRIAHYRRCYQPLADESLSFVKVVDAGRQVIVNRIDGYLAVRAVAFLMNMRTHPRRIWITRHGESTFNLEQRIGGDPPLSAAGERFAGNLAEHLKDVELQVWTSTLRRAVSTAQPLGRAIREHRALDEIDAGICDGMTYTQIEEQLADEFTARKTDKLSYRYPRGESYQDVILRLDPLIIEIERTDKPVLIVAHQAVLRALYAYLTGTPRARCPFLDIPLHTLIELEPNPYGCDEKRIVLGP